jgi:predicted secreted protein
VAFPYRKQVDQKYEPPEEGGMVGASGKEIRTFKALKKGESSISMEYSQPWDGGTKAAETFELTVLVR